MTKKKAPDRNCPTCGRLFPVYRNGAMRAHRTPRGDERCKGSFRMPTLPAPKPTTFDKLISARERVTITNPAADEHGYCNECGKSCVPMGRTVVCDNAACDMAGECPRGAHADMNLQDCPRCGRRIIAGAVQRRPRAPDLAAARKRVQPQTDAKNAERAAHAREALDTHYNDEPRTDVIDLIVDLRHYCRAERLDFAYLVTLAADHFDAEVTPDDIEVTSREAGF